jgi:serine/threonine protein kinase
MSQIISTSLPSAGGRQARKRMSDVVPNCTGTAVAKFPRKCKPRPPRETLSGTLFADRYELRELVSTGGNAAVYSAFDTVKRREVAVKIGDRLRSAMGWEWCVHMDLVASGRPPIFHDFIRLPKFSAVVMDLYDGSLQDVNRVLDNDVLRLSAERVLEQLRALHARGFVHRDVKPSNILWKSDSDGNLDPSTVVLVDFGSCAKYSCSVPSLGLRHLDPVAGHPFSGTVPFASRRQLRGISCSRLDDLESLGYTIMAQLRIQVPGWQEYAVAHGRKGRSRMLEDVALCRDSFFENLDAILMPEFLKTYFARLRHQPFDACPLYSLP